MLRKSQKTSHFVTASLLLSIGAGIEAYAAECGVVQYLENKSNGVEVAANTCKVKDYVAVGSLFNLMPGARLWIKSPLSPSVEKHFNAICQNRSSAAISIALDSAASPWIAPNGLKNCSGWVDNKLSCDGVNGEKNALYCVIAEIEPSIYLAASSMERTTSVTLRGIPRIKPRNETPAEQPIGFEKEHIITAMRPETELCRNVYQPDYRVKVEWIVDEQGQVINVAPHAEAEGAEEAYTEDKGFIDCIVDVVKYFPYPKLSKFAFLSASF